MAIRTAVRSRRASRGEVLDDARTIVERCLAREYLSLGERAAPTFAEYRDGFNDGTSPPWVAAIPLLYACGLIAAFLWALTL